eukprot:3940289-Rhodomonas_salina.1
MGRYYLQNLLFAHPDLVPPHRRCQTSMRRNQEGENPTFPGTIWGEKIAPSGRKKVPKQGGFSCA